MKCLACDKILSDREANRKYAYWQQIGNPEHRYVGLCDHCLVDTDLEFIENLLDNDEDVSDDYFAD